MNQREKFEAWAAEQWGDTASFDMKHGQYEHMGIRNHWDSWEAALAASGGNAAPGLALEKINELAAKHIQDICGISRPPAPMGEDHEFVILCRAIEAASAPNAALVAALERIAQPVNAGCGCDFPCRCDTPEAEEINAQAMRDIADEALAALCAAGQEVGHG